MEPADLDQLVTIFTARATASADTAAQFRRVADDLLAMAAGFVGLRHAADHLDRLAEADTRAAALFRRLALDARAPSAAERADDSHAEHHADDRADSHVTVGPDDDDWRSWTEATWVEDSPARPTRFVPARDDGDRNAWGRDDHDDDWDAAPLAGEVRLGAPPDVGV